MPRWTFFCSDAVSSLRLRSTMLLRKCRDEELSPRMSYRHPTSLERRLAASTCMRRQISALARARGVVSIVQRRHRSAGLRGHLNRIGEPMKHRCKRLIIQSRSFIKILGINNSSSAALPALPSLELFMTDRNAVAGQHCQYRKLPAVCPRAKGHRTTKKCLLCPKRHRYAKTS